MIYAYNEYFKKELPIVATYDNGTKAIYSDLLKPLAKRLNSRSAGGKKQNVILIEGRTGSGKSNVGIQLCMAMDKNWKIGPNYIYSLKDFSAKLKHPELSQSKISLVDEGSVVLNSMNSQRKEDVLMAMAFDTLRSFGLSTVICIPNRKHLNKRIVENHIDFLIKCPTHSPVSGYSPVGMYELYSHEYRDWGRDYFHPIGMSLCNCISPDVDREYQRIKREHQMEFLTRLPDMDVM